MNTQSLQLGFITGLFSKYSDAEWQNRTADLFFTREALYQLS